MTIKDFFSFRHNKYFWVNIIAIVVTIVALLFVALKGIGIYTHHGEAMVVPNVKGMGLSEAEMMFRNHGLNCVVADSSYVKNLPAGCIIDYNPAAGQKVKEGRTIYLTINTLNVPQVSVPDVADNSSVRQAQARILASGFKLDEIEYIPGEKDWVYEVKYRGVPLSAGEKVSVGATLTLVVGDGDAIPQEEDSLALDSIKENESATPDNKKSAADESWF